MRPLGLVGCYEPGVERGAAGGMSSLGGGQEGLRAALQRQLSAAQIQLTGFKAGTRSRDAGAD